MERNPTTTNNNIRPSNSQFVRGWSWGEIKINNNQIEFEVGNQNWFNIPYSGLSNALLPTKNEIGLEFNLEEEDSKEDTLCEMRLYIPNKNTNAEEEEENQSVSGKSDKSGSQNEQNEQKHSAEILKEEIMKYANVGTLEKAIALVTEVPMITPRGKFDLYFLKNQLKIHGPSHDYKISYKNMIKAFLLPKPDGTHFAFVVGLNNPLRQGNTTYPFLVFQFKTKNEKTVELNLPEDEEERKAILKSEITSELKGELFDVVAKLFKSIIGIAVVIPGNFRSSKNGSCIKCSLKASEGYIYPLERGLIFIHKPVVYINLDEIRHVEFSRISESTAQQRTFDLTIVKRNEEIQFLGVEKNELDPLTKYFANKKIKIKSNDGGNIQEIKPSTTTSNRRARPAPEEVPMDLPSESEFDEDFNSEDEMEVDDEEESGEEDKKKKKNK